eukprot:scaffold164942_cov49-Tisochrysis_lutea.AAC.2
MAEAPLALATNALPWQRGQRPGSPYGHTPLTTPKQQLRLKLLCCGRALSPHTRQANERQQYQTQPHQPLRPFTRHY